MSQLNNGFDTDIDSFLNLDSDYTSASATGTPHSAVPALAHQSSSNFGVNSQQIFAGPSFQYEQYRQQTGLPVGGLANTFAVNQNSGLQHFDGHGFVMPNEISNFPLTKLDDFDFGRHSSFDMNDMDFEDDSPTDMPDMYYAGGNPKAYISPTSLVASNASPSTSAPVQRIYPGMHAQQAAEKAQQAQQKQQEIISQQQQPRQVAGQKPLPKGPAAKDPAVEESISRILSQMRQKSISTTDEDGTPVPSGANIPRMKKEDDDMDEDERLLASEEGKKLTSKERRQLRNKVSARAFRSRRKEYIGQLEGDLNVKVDEANALRDENRQLREENNRLTDLTRMLLSSQAFSGFLQELSQTSGSATIQSGTQQARQERTKSQPKRKDVNPHEAGRQLQTQQQQRVGMVLMPETAIDMSLFETPTWAPAVTTNDFQVFSVTSLPQGPVLDLEAMSGKVANGPKKSVEASKLLPIIPEIPEAVRAASMAVTEKNKAGVDCQNTSASTSASLTPIVLSVVAAKPHHAPARSVTPQEQLCASQCLQSMCDELQETSDRLAMLMSGPDRL